MHIQTRAYFVENHLDEVVAAGYWFHTLDDKLSAYKVAASLGLNPPQVYFCSIDVHALSEFIPPQNGFVIRATDQHSNKGVYVLPNGFNSMELLRGIVMTVEDIISDLSALKAKKIIVEEVVGSGKALPNEYKFHVFDGEVASISIVANRGTECQCKFHCDILCVGDKCIMLISYKTNWMQVGQKLT
jgi:hypothetical protein